VALEAGGLVTARRQAKAIAEGALVAAGAVAWGARRHRGGVCILAYHNIVPDALTAVGDVSLHLRVRDFRRQLDEIGQRYDVVPLAGVLDGVLAGEPATASPRGRPRVAITFDDAYLGAVTLGVEELARRGFPATIFVPPGLLGRRAMWWDAFVPHDVTDAPASLPDVRGKGLTECAGQDTRVRELATRSGWEARSLPDVALTATDDELAAACRRHDGLSLGSHTWSHPNLTRLGPSELAEEMRLPLEWLNRRQDRTIPWLAYPYGLADTQAAEAARAAGYEAAVLVSGGWATPPIRDPFGIPRVNIPAGLSANGFALRVVGVVNPRGS
jgi:peptidoglycan/xylan/chitin deacetylase (PgdA/CDA1 family)